MKKYTKITTKIPNAHKNTPMVVKYSKRQEYKTTFSLQGPPKFTQIGILGLKRNHLATLSINL
jgi:hypothetical protein